MNIHAALAIAIVLAAPAWSAAHAQVRIAPTPGAMGAPPVVLPPVSPQPQLTAPGLTPVLPPPAVQVSPPPVANNAAEADGGSCTCPGGQKLDTDGWCWQETDAAHGFWQKTQKCE
jgi:hypothetical protein